MGSDFVGIRYGSNKKKIGECFAHWNKVLILTSVKSYDSER